MGNPESQGQPEEPLMQFPNSVKARRTEFFSGHPEKVCLTPEDIETMYGIASGTTYNEISRASSSPHPIPVLKLGDAKKSKVLISRRLFEEWLMERGNVWKVS